MDGVKSLVYLISFARWIYTCEVLHKCFKFPEEERPRRARQRPLGTSGYAVSTEPLLFISMAFLLFKAIRIKRYS